MSCCDTSSQSLTPTACPTRPCSSSMLSITRCGMRILASICLLHHNVPSRFCRGATSSVKQESGNMREAVVVASSRTPLAKSFRGSFNLTRPDDLAAHCIQDVLRKTPQLAASDIEDVVLGCAYPHGTQGSNVARIA